MIGLAIGAPIAGVILLLMLAGSLSESFAAWLGRYVNAWELFAALCFLALLIVVCGPIIEAAETGLAMLTWIDGGMR